MHWSISISPLDLIDSTNTAAYAWSQPFLPRVKRSTGFQNTVQSNCLSIRFVFKIGFCLCQWIHLQCSMWIILFVIIFTSSICTLEVQEAFMECNHYSSSLQHKCGRRLYNWWIQSNHRLPSSSTPSPSCSRALLHDLHSMKASSAFTDEFVKSSLLIRLWWVSVGGNFPFVVFLREKQLNWTSTASIMAQRRDVQSNKANKKWEQFTRVTERLIKIEMTKTAFLSPKIRTDGKKMWVIWGTGLCIELKLLQPLLFVDNQ